MCYKVGKSVSVNFIVVHDFGNGASLAIEGNPGNDVIIFPDGKIQHCDPKMGIWYYEKQNLLFIFGIPIQLEPGYDNEIHGERKVKAQDRRFVLSIKLLPQKQKQKEQGIFQVQLKSMTI